MQSAMDWAQRLPASILDSDAEQEAYISSPVKLQRCEGNKALGCDAWFRARCSSSSSSRKASLLKRARFCPIPV